jgi:hypothetical protein
MAFDLLYGKFVVGFIGGLLYGGLAVGGRYSFKREVSGQLSARPRQIAAASASWPVLLPKELLKERMVHGDDSVPGPVSDQLSCTESQLRCTSKACPAVGLEQGRSAGGRSMPCIARDAACKPLTLSGERAYQVRTSSSAFERGAREGELGVSASHACPKVWWEAAVTRLVTASDFFGTRGSCDAALGQQTIASAQASLSASTTSMHISMNERSFESLCFLLQVDRRRRVEKGGFNSATLFLIRHYRRTTRRTTTQHGFSQETATFVRVRRTARRPMGCFGTQYFSTSNLRTRLSYQDARSITYNTD